MPPCPLLPYIRQIIVTIPTRPLCVPVSAPARGPRSEDAQAGAALFAMLSGKGTWGQQCAGKRGGSPQRGRN